MQDLNAINSLAIPGLTPLLLENRKLEAIKLLVDHTGMSLAAAKQWVDHFPEGSSGTSFTNRESVRARRTNGQITVTYSGNDGVAHDVAPGHPLWEKAKSQLNDNPLLAEYEAQAKVGNGLPTNSSVFLENDTGGLGKLVKLATVALLVAAVLYLFLK